MSKLSSVCVERQKERERGGWGAELSIDDMAVLAGLRLEGFSNVSALVDKVTFQCASLLHVLPAMTGNTAAVVISMTRFIRIGLDGTPIYCWHS